MIKLLSPRNIYLSGFIIICILLSTTTYLQIYDNINPCPLCILQRLALVTLGIFFFLGSILNLKRFYHTLLAIVASLTALMGILLAGRQVWLQHLPSAPGETCGASLQYMLHVLPLHEVLKNVFSGDTECSQVNWLFCHLSLAEWSLLWFILLFVICLWQVCRRI